MIMVIALLFILSKDWQDATDIFRMKGESDLK